MHELYPRWFPVRYWAGRRPRQRAGDEPVAGRVADGGEQYPASRTRTVSSFISYLFRQPCETSTMTLKFMRSSATVPSAEAISTAEPG